MKRTTACVFLFALCILSGVARGEEVLKDFVFMAVDGSSIDGRALRGAPVVINFMATWCVPCKKEAPALERAYQAYKDRGVVFLGVFIASKDDGIRKFARDYGLTFPLGQDNGLSKKFISRVLPVTVFVSPDDTVRKRHFGPVSYEQLVEYIEEILAE